jgi:hypothetical protein
MPVRTHSCVRGILSAVIFAVYGDWLAGEPVSPAIVAGISLRFRPDDPSVCVWVDSDQPSVLCISVDAEAEDFVKQL